VNDDITGGNLMMFTLLFVARITVGTVIVRESCATVDSDALASLQLDEDMVAAVYLTDEPLMSMQAWTAARLRAGQPQAVRRAIVVVGCAEHPPSIGVAFKAWTPGMDCGGHHVDAVINSVDALHVDDTLTVKLEHLLRHLPEWHQTRHCSIGTERMRAIIFWLFVATMIIVGVFVRRLLADRERSKKR
jgi:hypothetical protein